MDGLGYGVSVNPSSSQYIAPTITPTSSIASQAFYFGGNPNVAQLTGNKWLLYGGLALAALYVYLRWR